MGFAPYWFLRLFFRNQDNVRTKLSLIGSVFCLSRDINFLYYWTRKEIFLSDCCMSDLSLLQSRFILRNDTNNGCVADLSDLTHHGTDTCTPANIKGGSNTKRHSSDRHFSSRRNRLTSTWVPYKHTSIFQFEIGLKLKKKTNKLYLSRFW